MADEFDSFPEVKPPVKGGKFPNAEVKAPTSGPYSAEALGVAPKTDEFDSFPEVKAVAGDEFDSFPEVSVGSGYVPPEMTDMDMERIASQPSVAELEKRIAEQAAKKAAAAEAAKPSFFSKIKSALSGSGAFEGGEPMLGAEPFSPSQQANNIKNDAITPVTKPLIDGAVEAGMGMLGYDTLPGNMTLKGSDEEPIVRGALEMGVTTAPMMLMGGLPGAGAAVETAVLSKVPAAYRTAAPLTTKLLGLLARTGGSAAAGAAENAVQAAMLPGSGDLATDMSQGAKVGALFGGGIGVATGVAKYFKPIEKVDPSTFQTLADEAAVNFAGKPTDKAIIQLTEVAEPVTGKMEMPDLRKVGAAKSQSSPTELVERPGTPVSSKPRAGPSTKEMTRAVTGEANVVKPVTAPPVLKKPQPAFKPSTAAIVSDGSGGLKAVVQELGGDGVRKLEMSLNNDSDRALFGDYAYKHELKVPVANEAYPIYGSLSPVSRALIERQPIKIPNAENLSPDVVQALKQIERDNLKTGNGRRPSLEAPVASESVVGVENGRIKFSSDPDINLQEIIDNVNRRGSFEEYDALMAKREEILPMRDSDRFFEDPIGVADTVKSPASRGPITRNTGIYSAVTQPNVPAGGAGGRGNTKEIPILYRVMKEAEKNKVRNPRAFTEAQDAYLLATGQRAESLKNITPQEVPNVPPPDGLPDHELDEINDIVKLVMELKRREPMYKQIGGPLTVRKGFLSWFANDNVRGPRQLREWINAMNGAKALASPGEKARIIESIREALPSKKLFDAAASDLDKVHLGRMSMGQFEARHGAIAADMKARIKGMMKEAQANSDELISLGVVPPDLAALRNEGIIDQYQAQVYKNHYLGKGQWQKAVPSNTLIDGIHYLKQKNPNWNSGQIVAEVLEIINADEPALRWQASGLNKPSNNLKKRQVIPPEIQKLMGKETSGAIKMAVTLSHQRSLLRQIKLWNEVAASPYFSPTAKPGFVALEPVKGKYGNAAGGFVSEELLPLIDSMNAPHVGFQVSNALGAWVKRNQTVLGGPKPWVNNIMRNLVPSHLSGGLPLYRPVQNAIHMKEALAAMKAWRKNPVRGSAGEIFSEAQQVGALSAPQHEMEMNMQSNKMLEEVAQALGTADDLYSGLEKLGNKLSKLNHMPDGVAAAYGNIDVAFKLANYISLKKQFLKKGMANEAAARAAADRINMNFINFEHAGRAVKQAKNSTFLSVAPYLTSKLEDIRVKGLIPKQLSEDPSFKWRLASLGVTLSAAAGALNLLGEMNGVTAEDREESFSTRSLGSQQYTPGAQAAPWRDEQGRVEQWDLGAWIPEWELAQGMPQDPTFAKIMLNLAKTPFSGSVYEPAIDEAAVRSGVLSDRPPSKPRDIKADRDLLNMIAPYFNGAGVAPGVVTSTLETLRKGGVVGQLGEHEEQLTGRQTAMKAMGAPVSKAVSLPSEVGRGASPSYQGAEKEYVMKLLDLKKQMVSIAASNRPPEEKRRLLVETQKLMKQLQLERQKIRDSMPVPVAPTR